jgi:hypothetical protein
LHTKKESGREGPDSLCDVEGELLAYFFLYFCDCVANGCNATGFLIGNLDAEHLFEFHKELYGVQGICTQVIGEARGFGNLGFFNAKLVNDDSLDLLYDFFVSHNE